ncbi:MAG TPA: hypothetical protein VNF68_07890 [Candidatus Baltobacteraceae bacterium]|nr:hypothetical protein [Candidatus Baltobacteraceae bacterium]
MNPGHLFNGKRHYIGFVIVAVPRVDATEAIHYVEDALRGVMPFRAPQSSRFGPDQSLVRFILPIADANDEVTVLANTTTAISKHLTILSIRIQDSNFMEVACRNQWDDPLPYQPEA